MPGTLPYVEAHFGRVADFGDRVVAYLIDTLISLAPLLLSLVGLVVVGASSPGAGDVPVLTVFGAVLAIVGYLGVFAVSIWNRAFLAGRTGQSIGKRSQGLLLVDAVTGQPIGAGNAFLRDVVHALGNSILYLSFLWMLWDPDKATLGDKAVHSTVLVLPKGSRPPVPRPGA